MSNTITIELCAEDRARLDRLAEALERRACDKCETTAVECTQPTHEPKTEPVPQATTEPLPEENTQEATAPNIVEETEPPTPIEEPATAPTAPTVDRAELRAKVIELSAKGLKEQTRDIVRSFAQTVTAVPDDKVAECYALLIALEG